MMDDGVRKSYGKEGMTGEEAQQRFQRGEEGKLHKLVISYLNLHGIYYECEPFGKRTQVKAGRPDFRICSGGMFIGIELKAVGGIVSREQFETLVKIRANGGIGIVAYTLQDVIEVLRKS